MQWNSYKWRIPLVAQKNSSPFTKILDRYQLKKIGIIKIMPVLWNSENSSKSFCIVYWIYY